MAVIKNTLTTAVVHLIATGTTIIAGNATVSNVAIPGQNVASASIKKIMCSSNSATGTWTISRGANVVWIASGNFLYDFQAHGIPLSQDGSANLVATLAGGNGSIIIEISKDSVI